MILKLLVLFFTPLLSGLLVFLLPRGKNRNFRLLLVFAGAYLFSITVIHILPELYLQGSEVEWIGLCVLAGFFLQQILEYFTSGIEHGHIHTGEDHHHNHSPHESESKKTISAIMLLVALCIHAFLEGGMLAESPDKGAFYDVNAVLLGIVLHRTPAAFALMTVLTFQLGSRRKSLPYLIGFSLAAPVGLFLSSFLAEERIISDTALLFLYAIVCGNFLHISTTIVFESSTDHKFNAKKLAIAIFGALVAIIVEQLM